MTGDVTIIMTRAVGDTLCATRELPYATELLTKSVRQTATESFSGQLCRYYCRQ